MMRRRLFSRLLNISQRSFEDIEETVKSIKEHEEEIMEEEMLKSGDWKLAPLWEQTDILLFILALLFIIGIILFPIWSTQP